MQKNEYDIILLGCGIAGSSLLYYLAKEKAIKKILVIDQKSKEEVLADPRRMSVWYQESWGWRDIVDYEWQKMRVKNERWEKILKPQKYFLGSLYAKNLLTKMWRVIDKSLLAIEWIKEDTAFRNMHMPSTTIIFDSRYKDVRKNSSLFMTGGSWKVQYKNDVFQPEIMTWMDTISHKNVCFAYLLPFSKTEAILEIAEVIKNKDKKVNYDFLAKEYLEKQLGHKFLITKLQHNTRPLALDSFKNESTKNTIAIGGQGGMVSSMSGFGLTRILKETKRMANEVQKRGLCTPYEKPIIYKLTDYVVLQNYKKSANENWEFYKKLYTKIDPDTLFQFLDEELPLFDILKMGKPLFFQ